MCPASAEAAPIRAETTPGLADSRGTNPANLVAAIAIVLYYQLPNKRSWSVFEELRKISEQGVTHRLIFGDISGQLWVNYG